VVKLKDAIRGATEQTTLTGNERVPLVDEDGSGVTEYADMDTIVSYVGAAPAADPTFTGDVDASGADTVTVPAPTLSGQAARLADAQDAAAVSAGNRAMYFAGEWFTPPGEPAAVAGTAGTGRFSPMWVPPGGATVDRIACQVTVAGSAGAVVRLGIYANGASNDYPGSLILDAGTVDATSTGVKEITISQAIPEGLVWLCAAGQVASCTMQGTQGNACPMWFVSSTVAMGFSVVGLTRTGMTGAFPGTAPSAASGAVSTARIAVRYV
jgi:hypothetical protein